MPKGEKGEQPIINHRLLYLGFLLKIIFYIVSSIYVVATIEIGIAHFQQFILQLYYALNEINILKGIATISP